MNKEEEKMGNALTTSMSMHGCVSSCPTCQNGCTICHPCNPERHGSLVKSYGPSSIWHSQKCDICGSTAIDHTEMQCQINRLSVSIAETVSQDKPKKNAQ